MRSKKTIITCLVALAGAAVLGAFLVAGGFAFAATQEARDPFCASCHTQPETIFVDRSRAPQPVDLAAFHSGHDTRCIDCHSGPGLLGRVSAELMGARNAFKWVTGTAVQPAQVNAPIEDANCLKCHIELTRRGYLSTADMRVPGGWAVEEEDEGEEEEGTGHWHRFLARWQAADANAASCGTCHPAHPTEVNAQNGFLAEPEARAQCDACHRSMGEGDD